MQNGIPSQSEIDVAIIGGGISALGIARSLSQRGYSVALFEKGGIGQATSANSLRIIHGGFRYLQSLNLSRSLRSIKDQSVVRTQYAQYVRDLPCVLPLVAGTMRTKVPLTLASLFYTACYGLLTGDASIRGRVHTANRGKLFGAIPGYGKRGIFVWDDVLLTDPDGFVQKIACELGKAGSQVVAGAEFKKGEKNGDGWNLGFEIDGKQQAIQAALVVNATGPWVQGVAQRLGHERVFSKVGWVRAVNLRLNRLIEEHYGIAFDGNNGSLYFMTPRDGHSVIGTFYDLWTKGADSLTVPTHEIAAMITDLNRSLSVLKIRQEEVEGYDVGLLPTRRMKGKKPVLVGSDEIVCVDGALHVLSTKYTTFQSLGDRVARKVEGLLPGS